MWMMRRYLVGVLVFCGFVAGFAGGSEPFTAGYHIPGKLLLLSEEMRGADGNVKAFDAMSARQVADIYHELWHAYFIECEMPGKDRPDGGAIYQAFRKELDRLYAEYPAEKRMEIHEEAVADYLDALTETYVQMWRFLSQKTPARRDEIRRHPRNFFLNWEEQFTGFYRGYYTKALRAGEVTDTQGNAISTLTLGVKAGGVVEADIVAAGPGLSGFIAGAKSFGMPVGFIERAAGKLEGVAFLSLATTSTAGIQADLVWSKWTLPEGDRRLIESVLLEGAFPRDPQAAFAEGRFGGAGGK